MWSSRWTWARGVDPRSPKLYLALRKGATTKTSFGNQSLAVSDNRRSRRCFCVCNFGAHPVFSRRETNWHYPLISQLARIHHLGVMQGLHCGYSFVELSQTTHQDFLPVSWGWNCSCSPDGKRMRLQLFKSSGLMNLGKLLLVM
jgi:hypothetical protein